MTLEKIKSNIKKRRYRRLDVFQQHMFELFEDVRSINRYLAVVNTYELNHNYVSLLSYSFFFFFKDNKKLITNR